MSGLELDRADRAPPESGRSTAAAEGATALRSLLDATTLRQDVDWHSATVRAPMLTQR